MHNENIAYIMPRVTTHAMTSSAHMQASRPPYVYMVCQELLMDMPFAQAKQYLSKLTASHFSTLNMDFCKLKCAEKDSHCHAQREQGRLE